MPRPDGKLYPSEQAALDKAEADKLPAKPKARMGRPPIVAPEPAQKAIVTMEQGLADTAKALGAVEVARNGKPLKATPERIAAIRDAVSRGLTIDKACILHGVHRSMLDKWKKANESILHLFEVSELESELKLVDVVASHAPDDWKAANWLLERRHSWVPPVKPDASGGRDSKDSLLSFSKDLINMMAGGRDALARAKPVTEISVRSAA